MNKTEYCKVCKNVVKHNGEMINAHITLATPHYSEDLSYSQTYTHLCIECKDNYLCNLDIQHYKDWCKKRGQKVDPEIIDKIKKILI